ncbi:MAG: RNA 2',3'-cyclic phosphodiesterase [Deltaproteobacteria bacterium]|nr:RNA 2',3'-cyclic phosphodiesterase [Deltaproteobacteria bacterium]
MRWRSFIAVELRKEIAEEVRRVQKGLQERVAGVRWVRPEGIHLTLKFLGEVDPVLVEEIAHKMEEAVRSLGPFTIGIRGGGGFPNARNPRVIWIGVDDPSGELREMQAKVDKGMEEIGFTSERRDYTPHLTVGRLRSGKGKGTVAYAIEAVSECNLGTMEVREVILFRSHLKPTGAEYTKVKSVPLETL